MHSRRLILLFVLAGAIAGGERALADDGASASDAAPPSPDAGAPVSCGDLLIVLDRSGSMIKCTIQGRTKEEIAKAALKGVIRSYPAIPMGLWVFPGNMDLGSEACANEGANACRPGLQVVPLTADGSAQVSAYLDSMPVSCGGTPTGATMELVRDHRGWSNAANHFVLLLTDGVPTCNDGMNGGGSPCNGGGCQECANPSKVYDSIGALAERGIHTFVVGFDGTRASCGALPQRCGNGGPPGPFTLNADTLNQMALRGGEALPGAKKYYSAEDSASLDLALKAIVGKIAQGTVGGCEKVPPSGGAGGSGAGGGNGGGGAGANDGTAGTGGRPRQRDDVSGCGCSLGERSSSPPPLMLLVLVAAALGARKGRRTR